MLDIVVLIALTGVIALVVFFVNKRRQQPAGLVAGGAMPMGTIDGTHAGARYRVEREHTVAYGDEVGTSEQWTETIAMQSPASSCRFVVDIAGVYRGQSDLYAPQRVRGALGLEVGPPFWRSDEPERLEWLKRDERFQKLLATLEASRFAALAVCADDEARIPLGSPARKLRHGGDVMLLTRRGQQIVQRDQNALQADLDLLTKLRDLLTGSVVPANLPRASAHSMARAAATRALRVVFLFIVIVAAMIFGFMLMFKHC